MDDAVTRSSPYEHDSTADPLPSRMSEESREARSVVDSIDDALHGDESLVLLSVDDLFVLRAALDLLDRLEGEIESWKRYKAAIDQAIEEGGSYKP